LEGIHSRTDFDLSSHQELSGKKMQYFDSEKNESYVPYVVETSIGVDRMFLSVISNVDDLKYDLNCFYEDKDTIGKRYRRQDAVGTPFCITIDHQTLEDETVTLRNRDTMHQERVNKGELLNIVKKATSIEDLIRS